MFCSNTRDVRAASRRRFGLLALAWLSLMAARADVPPSYQVPRLGVGGGQVDGGTSTAYQDWAALASDTNLGIIRVGVLWDSFENPQGVFDWADLDARVDLCAAHGLEWGLLLQRTPSWYRAAGTTPQTPPTNLQDYANMANMILNRYDTPGLTHYYPPTFLEVWNEPNWGNGPGNAGFWHPKPDPAKYGDLLIATYDTVKPAHPDVLVIFGGTSPGKKPENDPNGYQPKPYTFVHDVLAHIRAVNYAGIPDFSGWSWPFDAGNHHCYMYGRPVGGGAYYGVDLDADTNGFAYDTAAIHNEFYAQQIGDIRIWATEGGCVTHQNAVTGVGLLSNPSGVNNGYKVATFAEAYTHDRKMWRCWSGDDPWPTGVNLPVWNVGNVRTGPLFKYSIRDRTAPLNATDAEDCFGYFRTDDTRKQTTGSANDQYDAIVEANATDVATPYFHRFIQAERGTGTFAKTKAVVTAPMVIQSGTGGVQYAVVPQGQGDTTGKCTFTVDVTYAGTMYVWLRVWWPDVNGNSFKVNVDGGTKTTVTNTVYSNWQWLQVPTTYTVTKATHTFTVWNNEDGARLDKILITSRSAFDPNN